MKRITLIVLIAMGFGCGDSEELAVPPYLSYSPVNGDDSGTSVIDLCRMGNVTDATALVEITEVQKVFRCESNPVSALRNHYRLKMNIVDILRGKFTSNSEYILPMTGVEVKPGTGLATLEYIESVGRAGVVTFVPVEFLETPPDGALGDGKEVDLPSDVEELRAELNSDVDHCSQSSHLPTTKDRLDNYFLSSGQCGGGIN
jgi:hypothetical protein